MRKLMLAVLASFLFLSIPTAARAWWFFPSDGTPNIDRRIDALERYLGDPSYVPTARTAMTVVNVKGYGAVGDGVTDDSDAVQLAVSTASASLVYFPPGTYRVTKQIVIRRSTMVTGAGRGATKVVRSGAVAEVFKASGGNVIADMWVAHDGTTTATSGALVEYAWSGLVDDPENAFAIHRVKVSDGYDGIYTHGTSSTSSVVRVVIDDIIGQAQRHAHIKIEESGDARISNVWIDGYVNGVAGNGIGIYLSNFVEGVTMTNVEQFGCQYGLLMIGGTGAHGYIAGIHVSNSFFDTNALENITIANAWGVSLSNVWSAGASGFGISLGDTGRGITTGATAGQVKIVGCQVNRNGSGIKLQTGARFVSVIGTESEDNGTAGIEVAAGVTDFVIQGNTVQAHLNPAHPWIPTQATGILVATGASDRYIIADNLVSGNSANVTDNGTGVNKRVANNY